MTSPARPSKHRAPINNARARRTCNVLMFLRNGAVHLYQNNDIILNLTVILPHFQYNVNYRISKTLNKILKTLYFIPIIFETLLKIKNGEVSTPFAS